MNSKNMNMLIDVVSKVNRDLDVDGEKVNMLVYETRLRIYDNLSRSIN